MMTYFDILADTGAGLERVDIATTAAEAATTAADLAAPLRAAATLLPDTLTERTLAATMSG